MSSWLLSPSSANVSNILRENSFPHDKDAAIPVVVPSGGCPCGFEKQKQLKVVSTQKGSCPKMQLSCCQPCQIELLSSIQIAAQQKPQSRVKFEWMDTWHVQYAGLQG